ncbi:MAG: hypothetical protein Q9170_006551 [Blastenia crenularia]
MPSHKSFRMELTVPVIGSTKISASDTYISVAQILSHKTESRQSAEAKSPHPTADPSANGQYHSILRQAKTLAQDSYRHLVLKAEDRTS